MKFQAPFVGLAVVAAIFVPVAAFTPSHQALHHASSTTSLKGYMDAYDAQLRAMNAAASQQQQQQQPNGGATAAVVGQPDNFKLSQRWRKKTKQLATLGPASSSFEMIEKLFLSGADVFRLNFSHGEHQQKKELLDIIRQVEAKYDHPIAILGDLQGPKLRVGTFANPDGEMLQVGQPFRFDLDPSPGTNQRVMLPHPEIIEASQVGHVLLVDDGKVKLSVTGTGPGYIDCVVEVPGRIKDKKVSLRETRVTDDAHRRLLLSFLTMHPFYNS